MANFSPKLEDSTDKQLLYMVNELDFRVVPLASDELTRRSIKKLNESVDKNAEELKSFSDVTKKFDEETSVQTEKMIRMTQTMKTLTWVMAIVVITQVLLAIPRQERCSVSVSTDAPNIQKENCTHKLDFGIFGSYSWRSYEEKPNEAYAR